MTGMDELVTIVIPIYNAEKYVGQCLQSVHEQTYHNIEVIMVDDASSDGSCRVAERYMLSDSRFVLYRNEKNSGVSACRKMGIQMSHGTFITFLDDDDYLHPQAIEKMVVGMMQGDMCICSYIYDTNGQLRVAKMRSMAGRYDQPELCKLRENMIFSVDGYDSMSVYGTLTAKMFRRQLLLQNISYMDDRLWLSEDHFYLVAMLLDISSCYIIPDALYYYRQHPDQTVRRYRQGLLENSFWECKIVCVNRYCMNLLYAPYWGKQR
jgi:glycosyltransferase involved in cell wall biosynthesis